MRDRLDVLGGDVVAAVHHGIRPRGEHEGERPARGGAHHDRAVAAGGGGELDAVAGDVVLDRHGLHRALHLGQTVGVGDRLEVLVLLLPAEAAAQDVPLLLRRGVAEGHPHEEAVELGLGQGVGALVLDRVGGGEHVEGLRERERLALDGDLVLLHGLQQRRLGLGRRAVDLVGEQEPGEQRPGAEDELGLLLVEDERPRQVRGQQVGGELRAGEVQPEGLGEGPGGQCLAQAGKVLEEDVAAGQDRGEHEGQGLTLADDGLLDPVEDLRGATRDFLEGQGRCGGWRVLGLRHQSFSIPSMAVRRAVRLRLRVSTGGVVR